MHHVPHVIHQGRVERRQPEAIGASGISVLSMDRYLHERHLGHRMLWMPLQEPAVHNGVLTVVHIIHTMLDTGWHVRPLGGT